MTQNQLDYIGQSIHPHMEGWCSPEKAAAIAENIEKYNCKRCLEFGVFGGRSVVAMALAHKLLNWDAPDAIVIGVDPWRNEDCLEGNLSQTDKEWWGKLDLHIIHRRCMETIWNLGLESRVLIIRSTAHAAAPALGYKWDMIHVDSTHSEEASTRDVKLAMKMIRPGGVLVMDDIDWPTTAKAVALLDKRMRPLMDVGGCRFYFNDKD